MASDTILNDLWEIAQKNSKEEITKSAFQEELISSIYSKLKEFSDIESNLNNEFDRTLPIILSQAEVNPNVLGESKNGSFTISNEIISSAVKTVKYENQFIIGTSEYETRVNKNTNIDIGDVILTTAVISTMIDNYEQLTFDEKNKLWDNYEHLSDDEQDKIYSALDKSAQKTSEELRNKGKIKEAEAVDNFNSSAQNTYDVAKEIKKGEDFDIEKFIPLEKMRPFIDKELLTRLEQGSSLEKKQQNQIINKYIGLQGEFTELVNSVLNGNYDVNNFKDKKNLLTLFEFSDDLIEKLCLGTFSLENEEDLNQIVEISEKMQKRSEQLKTEILDIKENNDSHQVENIEEFEKSELNLKDIAQQFIPDLSDIGQENRKIDDIKTLDIYKEYFEKLDDNVIEVMRAMSVNDIIANIQDDFSKMDIGDEFKNFINTVIERSFEETKDILLDPAKREAFFEKIQSDLESQKDTELIKDSELVEIFRQASVELEVGEITQGREDDIQDNSSLLENEHMDTEYIVNGVKMNIDEQWLQFFQDAQEKGEDLAEAYENYKKEQEVEEIEAKKTEERKEDKAQDEQEQDEVIVEEDGTVKKQAEEETELSVEKIDVEGNEFFNLSDMDTLKNSKKSKRVAVVEKDEDGNLTNVQILKPVEFSKQTELTTHEFKETISELTTALSIENTHEKENGDEEISQD